jgi:type IV secretory pathway VirB3-like protein
MEAPDGWVVPEYRSLATRPLVLGLPPGYAVALIVVTGLIGAVAKMLLAALVLLGSGWGVGALVTLYDPYAWELFARQARVPRVVRAC